MDVKTRQVSAVSSVRCGNRLLTRLFGFEDTVLIQRYSGGYLYLEGILDWIQVQSFASSYSEPHDY